MNKKMNVKDTPFAALVLLIAGFAVYGMFSMSGSISNYSNASADVLATGLPYTPPLTSEAEKPKLIFTDVDTAHDNAVAIAYFKQNGIVAGYDDGSFKPGNLVSRAEFMKILAESVDADLTAGVYEKCFKDINREWYAVYACYGAQNKWVNGFEDGTFKPLETVTKAAALKSSFIALGITLPTSVTVKPFTDVALDIWYAPVAEYAKNAGIVVGRAFLGDLSLSRATTVQLIYDVLKSAGKVK